MNHVELVDKVLKELVSTRQPAVSVRRIFKKLKIDYTDDLIHKVEQTLNSKSLVIAKSKDSRGFDCYALTETGQDFIKTFGSYSKYLKGLESEQKKIERARKKKPYNAQKSIKGDPPAPYTPPERTFMQRNGLGIILLIFFCILFYIVSKITGA